MARNAYLNLVTGEFSTLAVAFEEHQYPWVEVGWNDFVLTPAEFMREQRSWKIYHEYNKDGHFRLEPIPEKYWERAVVHQVTKLMDHAA